LAAELGASAKAAAQMPSNTGTTAALPKFLWMFAGGVESIPAAIIARPSWLQRRL
jgi:uncharacterized iron-regulated membrane protein